MLKKKKKMDGALFNISPGWKVKLLPRSCIKTPPPWEAQPGKTNPPCVRSLAVQQSLSRRCDGVQNSDGGQRGEMEKMSVEETVEESQRDCTGFEPVSRCQKPS